MQARKSQFQDFLHREFPVNKPTSHFNLLREGNMMLQEVKNVNLKSGFPFYLPDPKKLRLTDVAGITKRGERT